MNGKKALVILAVSFLVQTIVSQIGQADYLYSLSPPAKVDPNNPDIIFQYKWDVIRKGLSIYELDSIGRCSKDDIIRRYNRLFPLPSDVRFDLEHIDIRKGGYTRYYPFSIGDNNFLIRIFLTTESTLQPKVEVLFEIEIEDPAVTFQILPDLSSVLKDCRIKPYTIYPNLEAARSP